MPFRFIDPGPLIDGELELIAPSERWVNDYLAGLDRTSAGITRNQILDFLQVAPAGRHDGDALLERLPCYHFWMRLHPPKGSRLPLWAARQIVRRPPLAIAGSIGLRIGHSPDIERNLGHIGYNVQPFARGNHYAERACRLLRNLALRHGLDPLWITCNPDNLASRRTCERLGATMVEIVQLPQDHPLRQRGDREKCRYRWEIGVSAESKTQNAR